MTNSPSELTVEDSRFYIYAAHYTIIDYQGLIQCVLAQLEYGSHKNKDHVSAREVTVLKNPEVAQDRIPMYANPLFYFLSMKCWQQVSAASGAP